MKHTGGAWDRRDTNIYFIASTVDVLAVGARRHQYLLVAVNEISTKKHIETIKGWLANGKKVFIDSGVYNLVNVHAREHNLTMDQALALSPEKINGFSELYDRYCKLIHEIGERAWGYIEIDIGGKDNKRKTRAKLEARGLKPIPVYHPLNDGWDYFDELASQYDRICFGNIVHAEQATRKRLLATAWERRRQYPHIWIHLLGMTPNEWLNAFPIDSLDSSSWLRLVRWNDSYRTSVMMKSFTRVPRNLTYLRDSEPQGQNGWHKNWEIGAFDAHMVVTNWAHVMAEYALLGIDQRSIK